MSNNPTILEIDNEKTFQKLKDFGTYYSGQNAVVTTVGVTENVDSEKDVNDKKVKFVFVGNKE